MSFERELVQCMVWVEHIGVPSDEENAQEKSAQPELIQKVIKMAPDFDMLMQG